MEEIRRQLEQMAEPDYQRFTASLLPGTGRIMGVRLPKLRRLAAHLAKNGWREYLCWAEACSLRDMAFEEIMLQGMVIGAAPLTLEDTLLHAARMVRHIDNWSVCDSFCAGLHIVRRNLDVVWPFLQQYWCSSNEFEARFGLVMLLDYYVREPYFSQVLQAVSQLCSDGYYAKMAAAWLLSECYVRYPGQTSRFLQRERLDPWMLQKTLQKIVESRRISPEMREQIRLWRREAAT